MSVLSMAPKGRQMAALVKKNLIVLVTRRPLGFLLSMYALPLAILAVLLSIPSFFTTPPGYGVGEPAPIHDLADILDKKLVIVRPPELGSDVDAAIERLTKPLNKDLISRADDESAIARECAADARGVSNCFATVTFIDSPETEQPPEMAVNTSGRRTWQYTFRTDPAKENMNFDVVSHTSTNENVYLPLVLAVNNAIGDRDDRPSAFGYTTTDPKAEARNTLEINIRFMSQFYVFIIFMASFIFIIYRFTSKITRDRESGMSQLVDSMGGRGAIASRILTWLFVIDIITLPCYIIGGFVYWHIRFPHSSAGLVVGWQILLGLAVNSSTVFAASFFTKARVSAIYVCAGFVLLAIGTQVFSTQMKPLPFQSPAIALTLLFPSGNFVLFIQQMFLWELAEKPAEISEIPPADVGLNSTSYDVNQATMLGFLIFQIFVYPPLAILVEWYMHGISFSSRSFNQDAQGSSDNQVVATTDLKKHFLPNIFKRILCCGTKKGVNAVNGVSIQGYRGQVLCLVGPNGSGKTTTLHMMAGFTRPTSGDVAFNAAPAQIGICPQQNTLWDELTVREHVVIWSRLKGGNESNIEVERLIASCDLTAKRDSQARTLSGGQKRKLQLACMFVGDSSVCLIDECTSGLDPLSRRVIWEILLQQRSKRSIIFTTHFLDEVDVLADHIVILSKGKVKCHGAVAELKNNYGNGYQVLVPHSAASVDIGHEGTVHQDRIVYSVPDSNSAMQLSTRFAAAGVTDVTIAGPQVEDVFLNVADDVELLNPNQTSTTHEDAKLEPGKLTSFWSQLGTIYRKRWTVFWRLWWPYLFAILVPIVAIPFMSKMFNDAGYPLQCHVPQTELYQSGVTPFRRRSDCSDYRYYGCDFITVGPPSANDSLYDLKQDGVYIMSDIEPGQFDQFTSVFKTRDEWIKYYNDRSDGWNTNPGFFLSSDSNPDVLSFSADNGYGAMSGYNILSLLTQEKSGLDIVAMQGTIGFIENSQFGIGIGTIYTILFTLLQALYPATFVLYPAMEKARKVRAIEYANGVRRAPLWIAYVLFDFLPVLIISIVVAIEMQLRLPWIGTTLIMLPILILYGLAAILLGYTVSHFFNGPLKSFLMAFMINILMFIFAALAFGLGYSKASVYDVDAVSKGIAFGVNLVLPIGNVFRALLLGFNEGQTRCKDAQITPMSSINAFGGPILYLVLQVLVLMVIIIWIEGDLALFRRKGSHAASKADAEKSIGTAISDDVEQEKFRVQSSDSDLLRILNFNKSFDSNKAVDNVTLGLPQSDVTALIGPNGAGKSTLVNLIQSELSPDSGHATLCGEDWRTRSAQGHLGVCPQFDALDLMNTREHLIFFARIKGVKNVKENVALVMARLGLTPHAKTLANKLSGGNKRKLSLAIAIIGAPPVLVLDEPTSAMDAVGKRAFWKIIKSIAPDHSILLTTHSMEEADNLATRAAILSRRLLAVGTTQTLREKYSNVYHVNIMLTSSPGSTPEEMDKVRSFVHDSVPSAKLERDMLGGQVRFTIDAVSGKAPSSASSSSSSSPQQLQQQQHQSDRGSNVTALITLLEENKQALGIEYYSISAATLETVFLSVVRANNVQEEDGVASQKMIHKLKRLF